MTNERLLELVNLEIDGELSSEEKSELSEAIARDAVAAALRDEMRRTSSRIDELEWVEPPPDFRDQIMAEVRSKASGGNMISFATEKRRRVFRYGWALAAGLLIGLLLGPALFDQPAPELRAVDATGAMRAQLAPSEWEMLDERLVNSDALEGSIEARRSGEILTIELALRLRQRGEVEIRYDAEKLGLAGISRKEAFGRPVSLAPGVVRAGSGEGLHATLFLIDFGAPDDEIELEIGTVGGQRAHERVRLGGKSSSTSPPTF